MNIYDFVKNKKKIYSRRCRHVRHSVPYVDLIDGKRQLQFCTEKCRNQYKMTVFCTETSSLGVQSKILPNSDVTSSNSLIDSDRTTSNETILITPDLWLLDSQLTDLAKSKIDHENSNELEYDLGEEDVPLNLSHSSQRSMHTTKRKLFSAEVNKNYLKKGKAHRKPENKFDDNDQTSLNSNIFSTKPLSSPWSQHLAQQSSLFLQSQLLNNLNGLIKPLSNDFPVVDESISFTPDGSIKKLSVSEETNTSSIAMTNSTRDMEDTQNPNIGVEKRMKPSEQHEKDTNLMPPNVMILRVPYLIPLLIPVPLPIPLNINEQYLEELLK